MNNKRPRIKIPYESFDIIIECISITIILLMWIYIILEYSQLPDVIASHFNSKGIADDYNSKIIIWIIPSIATGIYILLFIINRYPHIHNYMVNITIENAYKNYKFSTRILRIVNLFTVSLMMYVAYFIVESAKEVQITMSNLLLPIIIGFSILLPVIIFIYQRKLNKE